MKLKIGIDIETLNSKTKWNGMEWSEEMKLKIGIDIETARQVNKYLYIIITIVWYCIINYYCYYYVFQFNSYRIVYSYYYYDYYY